MPQKTLFLCTIISVQKHKSILFTDSKMNDQWEHNYQHRLSSNNSHNKSSAFLCFLNTMIHPHVINLFLNKIIDQQILEMEMVFTEMDHIY